MSLMLALQKTHFCAFFCCLFCTRNLSHAYRKHTHTHTQGVGWTQGLGHIVLICVLSATTSPPLESGQCLQRDRMLSSTFQISLAVFQGLSSSGGGGRRVPETCRPVQFHSLHVSFLNTFAHDTLFIIFVSVRNAPVFFFSFLLLLLLHVALFESVCGITPE